jgi:hypothetical protein
VPRSFGRAIVTGPAVVLTETAFPRSLAPNQLLLSQSLGWGRAFRVPVPDSVTTHLG